MIISTRGRYALRVMVDLAQHPTEDFVPVKEIAQRQEISKEYLNSILKELVQANFLESMRGKGGGYKLVNPPWTYSIGSILRVVEGDLAPVPCVTAGKECPRADNCPSLPMWKKLDKLINDFFDNITLSDLMEHPEGEYPIPMR